ncbi:cation antiporter [Xylanimonas cellulosilytica DSM 15894]|uniref:Cation antiporter n=1 Tax=Xylanimonas cellulosilytica (strain DSM 15894 / JCM 12276 / CECT 5975 / KCTC 9989 / LMG 20990 / NBRC 107835 / XIL07) TaxID=446471 RepID=D1BT23_XYLCX|nr:Na+/H+ antiporter subunit E [Xylanimonas cellulosilytica]ACZ30865.1 cation antiporter [Xylanimonas cellulosilytica DSM 15894]
MGPLRRNVVVVLLLTVVWVVMNEHAGPFVVVSGLAVGVVSLWLTNKLLQIDYATTVFLSPVACLRYALLLVKEITVAAVHMAVTIVRGRARITRFELVSELEDELLLFLLANSIILTPGSVALDRDGRRITVLTCDDDVERAVESCRRLERSVARLGKERS